MTTLPMGSLIRYHRDRKGQGAVALVHAEGEMTWGELEDTANRFAHLLQEKGAKPGAFVAIGLPNCNIFYAVVVACWKAGCIPVPLAPSLPRLEAEAMLDLLSPGAIVTALHDWPKIAPRIAPDSDLSAYPVEYREAPPAPYFKAIGSGGSTGRPKIVVDHMPAAYDPGAPLFLQKIDGTILNPGPLYHNGPLTLTLLGLLTGNKIVGMRRFNAEEAMALIEKHRVDWVNFVPTMMHRISSLPDETRSKYDISSLQTVWHMAAPMPRWLKEEWIALVGPENLWEAYGSTERQGTTQINGAEWLIKRGSVGRLCTPGEMKILRPDGTECAPEETGEIYIRHADGAGATYHYLGAEPRRIGDGWDSNGDLGYVDAEGYLFLGDRRTDLILRGGANIYPAEVEGCLEQFSSVDTVAVVGLLDPELGQTVHAIVAPRTGKTIDIPALHMFASERLAKYKLPKSYEIVDASLRDDAGKVRRSALRTERETWLEEGRTFQIDPISGVAA